MRTMKEFYNKKLSMFKNYSLSIVDSAIAIDIILILKIHQTSNNTNNIHERPHKSPRNINK